MRNGIDVGQKPKQKQLFARPGVTLFLRAITLFRGCEKNGGKKGLKCDYACDKMEENIIGMGHINESDCKHKRFATSHRRSS